MTIQYTARKAMMVALIESIESNESVRTVYLTVFARNPNATQNHPMVDVPADSIREDGTVVLNIGIKAVGYRQFGDNDILVSLRFNGVEHEVAIPYSLIAGVSGLTHDNKPAITEQFGAFMPIEEAGLVDVVDKSQRYKPQKPESNGTVVQLFGRRRDD
jgi:hypothetical protein